MKRIRKLKEAAILVCDNIMVAWISWFVAFSSLYRREFLVRPLTGAKLTPLPIMVMTPRPPTPADVHI
jgi:hypothetical protein